MAGWLEDNNINPELNDTARCSEGNRGNAPWYAPMCGSATAACLALVLLASGCSLLPEDDDGAESAVQESAAPSVVATASAEASASTSSTARVTAQPSPSVDPPASAAPSASAPSPEGSPSVPSQPAYPTREEIMQEGTTAFCELIEEEGFCEDANGNVWPDAVDEALGRDSSVDECFEADCLGMELDDYLATLQSNTLFILDASGSMAGDAGGGQTKMVAAKDALVGYVQATPDYADLGLMVYGHRGNNSDAGKAESCAGIDTFAPVGELTAESAATVVEQFEATGWTPIAASLDAAGPVLQTAAQNDEGEGLEGATNRIILISDGIETCDGDPVVSAQALVDLGIQVVVDVIGFDVGEADRAALQAVAETTGGVYRDAANANALQEVFQSYRTQAEEAVQPITCQIEAIARGAVCSVNYRLEASRYIQNLGAEAIDEGDRDRGRFLQTWSNVMVREAEDIAGQRAQEMRETLEELQATYEDARVRADEAGVNNKLGKRVATTFRCRFSKTSA